MIKYRLLYVLFITLYTLLSSDAALASGGGAAQAGEDHGIAWGDLFWPFVNFFLLVGIIVFFTRKPFSEFFKSRTEKIENSIKEAAEAKALAEKTLAEVRERLKNSEQETGQIIDAARKTGEKEKEALIAEGEHMKQKIVEQAKASIEFELEKAKQSLKSEAALLALEAAEKEISSRLGSGEQEKLIDEYIKKIEVKS